VEPGIRVWGDQGLLRVVMQNLLDNAWKFTAHRPRAHIEFGVVATPRRRTCCVRDDGIGFNMEYVTKLFGAFQRLHADDEYPGTGIGLATGQRIIKRHGGHVWAEADVDVGAAFFFTLEFVD